MSETHVILNGKVRVYKRETGNNWFCAAFIQGKNRRISTKEKSLANAKEFAEDWYFSLREKQRQGTLQSGPTFAEAAEKFLIEYQALTAGERHPMYVQGHRNRARNHLIPFFGEKLITEITPGLMQEYRIKRMMPNDNGKVPARSTMHHEEVTLRQIMKTALRYGWIDSLPDFSAPYKASGKISHRGWFSPEEYKTLYKATRENAKAHEGKRNAHTAAQLHDKVLFMANTGLRPDEVNNLEYRDVEIVKDEDTDETILLIRVRGKRGVGYCKSTKGAVFPFQRLVQRNQPFPEDVIFPHDHKKQFNGILEKIGLKKDRQGNSRTFYSLRHSYISFRLLEGADIYQIAKNCRTSVEMIEKHYAVHLKNAINAADINIKRRKPSKRQLAEAEELNTYRGIK